MNHAPNSDSILDLRLANHVLVLVLIANAASAAETWDQVVDLDESKRPCAEIQQALNPYLTGEVARARVLVKGSARIRTRDLNDRGDYLLCFGAIPGKKLSRGYPVGRVAKLDRDSRLSVHFSNVLLSYDAADQDRPVVIAQWGNFYQNGWGNAEKRKNAEGILRDAIVSGSLEIRFTGDADEGWKPGRIPGLPFTSQHMSQTTSIGWFESGFLHSDLMSLHLNVIGSTEDDDDIGFVHQHGWGLFRGHVKASRLGVGLLFYGNSVGGITSGYVNLNEVGVALGDQMLGADVSPSPTCLVGREEENPEHCGVRKTQIADLMIRDMVIEGNKAGNLLIHDAERCTFDNVHFEMRSKQSQGGHSIVIGAGHCGGFKSDSYRPCGLDTDCQSGRCVPTMGGKLSGNRIVGGSIGGDRYHEVWDGLVLGPGAAHARREDVISIDASIIPSNHDGHAYFFRAHPNSRLWMDLSGAQLYRVDGIVRTPYDFQILPNTFRDLKPPKKR